MKAEERRELWESLGAIEDWLGGGPRRARPQPDFEAAAGAAAAAGTATEASLSKPSAESAGTRGGLEAIAAEVRSCSACRLASSRKNAVPGEGAAAPLVLVVGEGPGAEEDASGRPFVGPAGQLLDKMLASIGLDRGTNCFIANVVKCRPPRNRDPESDERDACIGYLRRQIEVLRPKAILCAGRVAAQALLGTDEGIGRLRGSFRQFYGTPLLATYHPSALLRDESLKRPAWEDLKILRDFLADA
jgi:uracil-DNA glycosylase family 4